MSLTSGDAPKVFVIGVGLSKFHDPNKEITDNNEDANNDNCLSMARDAVLKALIDADLTYSDLKQACVGSTMSATTHTNNGNAASGQQVLHSIGLSGIPIFNLNGGCTTGSTTLYLAKQMISNDNADCILVLGYDSVEINNNKTQKNNNDTVYQKKRTKKWYSSAAIEYMKKYPSINGNIFGRIAEKNYQHSQNNPYIQLEVKNSNENNLIKSSSKLLVPPPSLTEILKGQTFDRNGFLTKLQCCRLVNGAAACILANEEFVRSHQLESQAVEIIGMEMITDLPTSIQSLSMINAIGYDMTRQAAKRLFRRTNLTANDIDVIELHDNCTVNELLTYEALGLCRRGRGGDLIESGDTTYGGKYVINPSGGLLGRGHSLSATGLAQLAELCWQLRGLAGFRQVNNAKYALQHNMGLGDSVIVGLYGMGFFDNAKSNVLVNLSKL